MKTTPATLGTDNSIADTDPQPGQLLIDLERRQDDVIAQLDQLDTKLRDVLRGLGVSDESIDHAERVDDPARPRRSDPNPDRPVYGAVGRSSSNRSPVRA